LLIQEKYSSG